MNNQELIEKKNQMILLMDCYLDLLTDKQKEYLESYYYEDLSISEIAEHHEVSRNAVFDQIKRAGNVLIDYENKLHLLEKHIKRKALLKEIEDEMEKDHERLIEYLNKIREI